MDTDALMEKDYLLQLKEGPISKFIKYYENIISDDEKSKLSAKEGKGIIIHVQGVSIVLDNNEIDEQDFNEYKEIYELVDDNYDGFDESKKPPKIPETPAVETTETPAVETTETPAPETPAPETPAPETPAPETPAPETTETPAPETTETPAPETPAPATMKKKKKPKKNKTQKKKGRKKNKKNKKNKKKKQRGGGGTHSKPSSDEEKSATDMFAKAFGFGPDIFNIQEESKEAISNTEGRKTGETTTQPTARILDDTVVDENYYANKTLNKPSTQDFVPKYTERKPSSTSLASGKSFSMNDPFGLKQQQRAPPLVVGDIPIGHAHFRAPRDRANQKKTKREITELKSNTLKTCADLKAREEEIANLKEKTSKMSKNADDFAEAMKALKKQQQNQGCVVSGGKKSRRKKKKNKKKKNRKKSTRKKRRK